MRMKRRVGWCIVTGVSTTLAACSGASHVAEDARPDAVLADGGADAGPVPYGCGQEPGGPDGPPRPSICDFAHMAFRVTDLQKARAFYGDYLGLSEPFRLSDTTAVYKINDSQFIELYQEAAPPGDTNYQLKNIAFS